MISITREGGLAIFQFQRPEKKNALTPEMIDSMNRGLAEALADPDLRAIYLGGDGDVFCSGADLSQVFSIGFTDAVQDFIHALEKAHVPVVVGIQGAALGAGLYIALAADFRVVAPDAKLGVPAIRLGVALNRWTVRKMSMLMGAGPAKMMLLAAEDFTTEQAFSYGLVSRIGTPAEALEWARHLAVYTAPLAFKHMKNYFMESNEHEPESTELIEAMRDTWRSKDAQEAVAARFQKRAPVFRGQ